jgi:hypothetical protein
LIDKEIRRLIVEEQMGKFQKDDAGLIKANEWTIEIEDTTVFVKMRSHKDGERYLLRITTTGYPFWTLHIDFVDFSTRTSEARAWPVDKPEGWVPVFRVDRRFVCLVPKAGSVWSIPEIILRIQYYLDYDGYVGRYSGS